MEPEKNITLSDQDVVHVDLSFLYLEDKINEYWTSKGRPVLLKVRDITDDVMWIGRSAPPCAIYIRSVKTLIRSEEKGIRWAATKRAFKELISDIKIIE